MIPHDHVAWGVLVPMALLFAAFAGIPFTAQQSITAAVVMQERIIPLPAMEIEVVPAPLVLPEEPLLSTPAFSVRDHAQNVQTIVGTSTKLIVVLRNEWPVEIEVGVTTSDQVSAPQTLRIPAYGTGFFDAVMTPKDVGVFIEKIELNYHNTQRIVTISGTVFSASEDIQETVAQVNQERPVRIQQQILAVVLVFLLSFVVLLVHAAYMGGGRA